MDYDRFTTYLRSIEKDREPLIDDIEAKAIADTIPIARYETVSFLESMICLIRPEHILEVGSAYGYSTVIMACAQKRFSDGASYRLDSIERSNANYAVAVENLRKAEDEGIVDEGKVNLIFGDATDVIPKLHESYDIIFMDAAKAQYLTWLDDVVRLLNKGGVLISDNVLQDGQTLESRFAVERRDRTTHKRMRDYLYELKHHDQLKTCVLNIGDGISLSVKL